MDVEEQYKQWLKNTPLKPESVLHDDSGALYRELLAASDEPDLKKEMFGAKLSFGTAGLRGVLGPGTARMNLYTVGQAALGLARYLKNHSSKEACVAIAYDSRHMSREFAEASAAVLNAQGVAAYLFEQIEPTPVLSYAVRWLHADAGVMVTASHNPSKYNGYKVFGGDGAQAVPEVAEEIHREMNAVENLFAIPAMSAEEARGKGLLRPVPEKLLEDYYDAVETTLIDKPSLLANAGQLKLVYTPLFGCGNVPVCTMLDRLGVPYAVVKEQQEPDGDFPGLENPNPEFPEAFALAVKYGKQEGATLLVATDPDSDRIGIMVKVGEKYRHFTGNQTGCLLLEYILTKRTENGTLQKNAGFVKTIVTSALAQKIADAHGVETFDVLTGFKFIADKVQMLEEQDRQFVFGFEESYGYLAGSFVRDKDAVIACMLICEMAAYYASQHMTLWDALQGIYAKYGYSAESVKSILFEGLDGAERMKSFMELLRENPPKELAGSPIQELIDYREGLRKNMETGNMQPTELPSSNVLSFETQNQIKLIIRPSGTEPKIKFYYFTNGNTQKEAEDIMCKLRAEVDGLISEQ